MRYSFRTKLLAILGTAALAFILLIVMSATLADRVERELTLIEGQLIPKLEFGPKIESCFERLRRGIQDAVAAQDAEALHNTRAIRDNCLSALDRAAPIVGTGQAVSLRMAMERYDRTARDVSHRLIEGESGDAISHAIVTMQTQHEQVTSQLKRITEFDPGELTQAFADASAAQMTATRIRLIVTLTCLLIVLLLSLWMSRGVLRSVTELASGFERFGHGDFATPIAVVGSDELAELARQANQMAASLKRLNDERDRADWIKAGHAGLVHELRGELEPEVVANQALRHLASYLGATAAALYWQSDDGSYRLLGHYACTPKTQGGTLPSELIPGEGILGQAVLSEDLTVVTDLPDDYFRVGSSLGEGQPKTMVLLPLVHLNRVAGVLELALFKPWPATASELLLAVRETLAIAIDVARARAALHRLLLETQQQAERLAAQEDELVANNEELHAQQDELREANTELTQQAEELEHQRRSLEESNRELRTARETLEEKARELTTISAYKSQFLANMSHELRTPLNSMLLLSNLLAENEAGNLTDRQVEFARTVHGAGKDLLALINQVLDLAKVESGKQEVHPESVQLVDLAAYAQRIFEPQARDKKLELTVQVEHGKVRDAITTDSRRVEQILNNLLGNAIKFTERGKVTLTIGPPAPDARLRRRDLALDAVVALSVSDTGVGIALEDQERIFAPFEQIEGTPDRRYGGTGLGLSIARELASMLGGELQIQSRLGKGSTFTCFLPLTLSGATSEPDVPVTPLASQKEVHAGQAMRRARQPLLLVIEDDPLFAHLLSDIIHELGLQARIAPDGLTGLKLSRECLPSGIILDVKLSGADGFAVMEGLKADPATRNIPVHFISAMEGRERGLSLGAVGYLTKPASRADLIGVVQSLVPGVTARRHRVLIVEDDLEVGSSLSAQLRAEHIETTRVTSAKEALDTISKEHFCCLVLDLGLPDMDGLQFLEILQREQGGNMPPVLVYTGRPLSKQEMHKLEAYTEAIILKEGPAAERLLDEIRLFVQRLDEGGPMRPEVQVKSSPAEVDLQGRRILVADDDMRTVYALSALLRAKGVELYVADTGRAALSVLHEHPEIELVLMDIMMPEMDGYEAMQHIRRDEKVHGLPIIALTAKAMRIDREKCLEAGASDYLTKPIDADRLLAMIRKQLPQEAQHGSA